MKLSFWRRQDAAPVRDYFVLPTTSSSDVVTLLMAFIEASGYTVTWEHRYAGEPPVITRKDAAPERGDAG